MSRWVRNALTIDLEDWFHPGYIADKVNPNCITPMIEESTEKTLRLLDELQIKSTFFVNGHIAEAWPHIIREIKQQDHEIASHGYSHSPLWRMTPKEFAEDISRSNMAIKKAIGIHPIGFRAPSFSLSNKTRWAIKILEKNGYLYDSSVFPMKTPYYGVNGVPLRPYRPSQQNLTKDNKNGKLIEFPVLATPFLGIRIPTAGGFYFRIIPVTIIRYAVAKANRKGYPAMMFFHPWEILENIPRVQLSPYRRFISYVNLSRMEKQIRSLAKTFKFAPVCEILDL